MPMDLKQHGDWRKQSLWRRQYHDFVFFECNLERMKNHGFDCDLDFLLVWHNSSPSITNRIRKWICIWKSSSKFDIVDLISSHLEYSYGCYSASDSSRSFTKSSSSPYRIYVVAYCISESCSSSTRRRFKCSIDSRNRYTTRIEARNPKDYSMKKMQNKDGETAPWWRWRWNGTWGEKSSRSWRIEVTEDEELKVLFCSERWSWRMKNKWMLNEEEKRRASWMVSTEVFL